MLAAGTEIGRYQVTRKLAEGGMAEIYLARAVGPEGFSKDVVIKVVRSFLATDPQFVQMFIAEARLASKLNHANVVQIFDFGKHEDTYYLAMEYVRGASLWDLRQRCRQEGVPFPATLAGELGAQIARGLHYAHTLSDRGQKLGVVHRDVTPHNVLLSFDGAVKITDFGIAKATTTHTAPGMLKGKFAYMSPEQARGEPVDARTDIFALGIVLWELLTGGRLFDGDSELAVLRAVESSVIAPPARLNPDVPQDLSDIVMKALARPLPERFQSAFEFEKALATWVLRTAQTMEDTSISLFLQQLYRAEVDADERPGTPAHGAAAVSRVVDDLGSGDTMAVDRSRQHAADAPAKPQPTMTMTPVREAPRSATPRPRGVMDDEDSHSSTEEFRPHKPGTEQMPAYKPGSGSSAAHTPGTAVKQPASAEPMKPAAAQYRPPSRRLEPLVVVDESQVTASPNEEEPTDEKPKTAQYRPASRRLEPLVAPEPSQVAARPAAPTGPAEPAWTLSETETAAPEDLPIAPPPKSKAAFAVVGALAVLALATAAYFVTRPADDVPAPTPVVVAPPIDPSTPPVEPPTPPVEPKKDEPPTKPAVKPDPAPVITPPAPPEVVDAGPSTAASPEPKREEPERTKPTRPAASDKPEKPRLRGTLTVRATPYADIFDGKRLLEKEVQGTRSYTLSAGPHEIVFVHRNKTEKRKVVIKANETTSEIFDAMQ